MRESRAALIAILEGDVLNNELVYSPVLEGAVGQPTPDDKWHLGACERVHTYICTYVYIHTCVHVYIYIYIYIYVCVYIYM